MTIAMIYFIILLLSWRLALQADDDDKTANLKAVMVAE